MKKILLGILTMAVAVAAAGSASALTIVDYPAGAAANGIGNTRHNMGSFGPVITTNGTTEICVFCHTPHHTNTGVAPAPLWNRTNMASTYTAYGTTLGGTLVSSVGSVTLACLSCHDGVTTWDNLVNAPGAGGVNKNGTNLSWRFKMPGSQPLLAATIDHFDTSTSGPCISCHVNFYGLPDPVTRLTIGTNLTDDHPMSVTYTPGRAGLRATSTVINSIDLTTGLASSAVTAYGGNLAQNRWAIKGFISNTATIGDLLRNGKVECSSCHDPHFKNLSWDETESKAYANWCGTSETCTDGQFLRRVGGNTGSGVCRTCHDK